MTQLEKKTTLGRGLASLLGVSSVSLDQIPDVTQNVNSQGVQMVKITDIRPGQYQPRTNFDQEELEALSLSIRENGIIQPIILRPKEDDSGETIYEIIAGERRWRASEICGLEMVPAIIRELSDIRALEIGLIENVQRRDLMPLEESEAYQRLMEEFGHTQEELSKVIGKSRSHIANLLRLNSLPASVKQLLNEGALSVGHVRAIIGLENIQEIAQEIAEKKSSVREVEILAKEIKKKKVEPSDKKAPVISEIDGELVPLIQKLESVFRVPVKIKSRGTKGEIILSYNSLEGLDYIMKVIDGSKL